MTTKIHDYEKGDAVRVVVGAFRGRRGTVTDVVLEQEKSVGVRLAPKDAPPFVAWFCPGEVEKIR